MSISSDLWLLYAKLRCELFVGSVFFHFASFLQVVPTILAFCLASTHSSNPSIQHFNQQQPSLPNPFHQQTLHSEYQKQSTKKEERSTMRYRSVFSLISNEWMNFNASSVWLHRQQQQPTELHHSKTMMMHCRQCNVIMCNDVCICFCFCPCTHTHKQQHNPHRHKQQRGRLWYDEKKMVERRREKDKRRKRRM